MILAFNLVPMHGFLNFVCQLHVSEVDTIRQQIVSILEISFVDACKILAHMESYLVQASKFRFLRG